jgi:hypothetical protein
MTTRRSLIANQTLLTAAAATTSFVLILYRPDPESRHALFLDIMRKIPKVKNSATDILTGTSGILHVSSTTAHFQITSYKCDGRLIFLLPILFLKMSTSLYPTFDATCNFQITSP